MNRELMKVNKNIIWVLVVVLLAGIALSNGKYTYDQFKTDFTQNPLAAAHKHPEQYMKHIHKDPDSVKKNPAAYEKVISQNVKYINQNKKAFKSYAETKGVKFKAVEGDFKSFDLKTGRLVTKGAAGKEVVSFTFNNIKKLNNLGGSNFKVKKNGELEYSMPSGDYGEKQVINLRGKLTEEKGAVYLKQGKFSGGVSVTIGGKNKAKLIPGCGRDIGEYCGLIEVEVIDRPIKLPRSVLLKGKAVVKSKYTLDLLEKSKIQNGVGATFEVSEKTKITFNVVNGCDSSYSCIEDSIPITSEDGKSTSENVKIHARENNKLKVNIPDGVYKDIVVKQIKKPELVQVGTSDDTEVYVDHEGKLRTKMGYLFFNQDIKKRVLASSQYQVALKRARKLKDQSPQVDLTLSKKNKQKTNVLFSAYKPISRGSLSGIKTNLGHVFEHTIYPSSSAKSILDESFEIWKRRPDGLYTLTGKKSEKWIGRYIPGKGITIVQAIAGPGQDQKLFDKDVGQTYAIRGNTARFPWMIYNGKPSVNSQGKISTELSVGLSSLLIKKNKPQLQLLFGAFDTLRASEIDEVIRTSASKVDVKTLESILDKYHPPKAYTPEKLLILKLRALANSKSSSARKLQMKLLDSKVNFGSEDISNLIRSIDNPKIQERIISKTKNIPNPAEILVYVQSDKLRKKIIEKARIIGDAYSKGSLSHLTSYLGWIKALKPELQRLALNNIDFKKGVFIHHEKAGSALKSLLISFKDKPIVMKQLLSRLPQQKNFGLNPQIFSQVYFDSHFQKNTKKMDFANKYSIALTAQRYLERTGAKVSSKNIEKTVKLIMDYRKKFSKREILGKKVYYIPITHRESRFENDRMVKLARKAGVTDIAATGLKGKQRNSETKKVKKKFLDYIENSKPKGRTTIHFSNHGGPKHQWLSDGQAGAHLSDEMHKPNTISYVELGDSLIKRGKLSEVNILIDSCYSKDFTDNLYAYLHKKGVKEMPTIVTETNRGSLGWGDTFISALEKVSRKGQSLTGKNIYRAEKHTFETQDMSVTMPLINPKHRTIVKGRTSKVIDLGSTDSRGVSKKPSKIQKKKETEANEGKVKPLPPTVIEIAKIELGMQKQLVG